MKLAPVSLVMLALVGPARAHPLEDATYETAKLCGVVNAITLEDCGNDMTRSPENSAARKSLARMYAARMAFMRGCQSEEGFDACAYRADWLMLGGTNRAMDEEAKAKPVKRD